MISASRRGFAARATTRSFAGLLLALAGAGAAEAEILQVPAEFDTIQAAIDAARDGDIVAVNGGVYAESIDFQGKAISVVGVIGPGFTTIDASGLGASAVRFVTDEPRTAVLRGFTITGGVGTPDEQDETRGGAVLIVGSSPTFMNCVVSGNTATQGGGLSAEGGNPLISGCEFVNNFAGNLGGGVRLLGGAPELVDCSFIANIGTNGGGVACESAAATILDCQFSGNTATNGCGLFNDDASPLVSGCTFTGNSGIQGGGIQNDFGSPVIRFCDFIQNTTTIRGGAMFNNGAVVFIANCRFHGNSTNGFGGGLWNFIGNVTMVNCVLTGNGASLGGGVSNESGGTFLAYQCSLTGNTALMGGGVFNASGTVPTIINSVLWDNLGGQIMGDSTVEHTVVQGGFAGANNLDVDPQFVDADGQDNVLGTIDDDLRLADGSPAIDAGRNDIVPADFADLDDDGNVTEPTPRDLDLEPRFLDDPFTADTGFGTPPIVDLGAYEHAGVDPADVNGDGEVDVDDLLAVLLAWGPCQPGPCPEDINGDGNVDVDDLLAVILGWSES